MKNHPLLPVLTALLGFMILLGGAPQTATAAGPPPWQQHLQCAPEQQHFAGVAYCTAVADASVHVIVVDLHSPGVGLEYVMPVGLDSKHQRGECRDVNRSTKKLGGPGCDDFQNRDYYPVMSLTRAVEVAKSRFQNVAIVVNSDYGARTPSKNPKKWRDHGPEGFTVVRGDRLDGADNGDSDNNAELRPWLAVSRDAPLRAEFDQFAPDQDKGGKPAWVYTGVGGWPWLVRQGVIQEKDIRTCRSTSGACRDGVDQTAVGLSQDHRWLFLVVDLRKRTLRDTADFMRNQLDVWDAMKFDGGSSTQLAYAGRVITQGGGRQLSQYLAVIAQPGLGIEANDTTTWDAQPTSPLFFAVVIAGATAHLHIEVQNTGTTSWEPQRVGLKIVEGVSGVAGAYPLSHAITPGATATWDIDLNPHDTTFMATRLQMVRNDEPFGAEITALVIVLPERLRSQQERIQQVVQQQVQKWKREGQREADKMLRDLEQQLQRELEHQVQNWFDKTCGGSLALGLSPLVLAMVFSRRKRKR